MITLRILATTLLVLCTAAAEAAPTLRAEVTVNSAVVTVGDMFDDAGILAEKALFRAPVPGTTGLVDITAVTAAARRAGLTQFENIGVLAVRVTRDAMPVDGAMLGQLIGADLVRQGQVPEGAEAAIAFDQTELRFNAEVTDAPAHLINLRYTPSTGAFVARFGIAGIDLPVDVTGRIEMMVEAPHLIAPRPAGTVLTGDDIEMRKVPLRYADNTGIVAMDQLLGKQLDRPGRAGLMLRAGDVSDPQVVARNQMVTVVLKVGAMTLTIRGQALNAAATGQPVQVLNPVSKKIISGTALANGAVQLIDTINVAGL